ncbi:MAG: ferritin [Synergistaceae bacterium]|nr:ferritin [Synergistaceae bacterium]
MIIDPKMEKALNGQVAAELESAYLYLSMAAWFEANDLGGCAHWMKKQAAEEQEHAMKIFDYLSARGGHVILEAIPAPRSEWKNATEIFEQTLAHEQKVTQLIYALVELSMEMKDYATRGMLSWFVQEQVEEEETAMNILAKFRKLGDIPISLAMLDKELGER